MGILEGTPWDRPPRCERCDKLESECACPPAPVELKSPSKQTARLAVEKRAKGKVVTIVRGLAAADNDLRRLIARLQAACGAGGSLDGDDILLQGRHLEKARALLSALGYKVKG